MSEVMEDEKVVYSVHELKKVLGIGINQCYDLVKTNQFPVKHIGNKIVVPIEPFKKWLNG